MSALHKLKAYFGMVPADEVDEYGEDVDYRDHYADSDYDASAESGRRRGGVRGSYQPETESEADDYTEEYRESARPRRQWPATSTARSAPAGDSQRDSARLRAVTDTGTQFNLSKITTLHPRTYSEARTIGEQYRDGTPVIINLTEMDEADAKRLVDFAAGLAFALRGSIDKITNRVFLLSPPNVDVTAEGKRRLSEGTFFNYG
ncbi:cell division protein SepF [Saccharopolyspora rectivirgula]|uniref:Cell division protein SepF n=1 Tax=Saccharopolyspora rectivirgula TaxID=28042 RepID=A0A073B9K7_9PSEU|nr:cell division protein SepF [Saccharopolyspora rectivirgula]KEI44444.1 cell division protein SepF [Saccharopolyspora rectivirgula]